jgi:hypothetical protein
VRCRAQQSRVQEAPKSGDIDIFIGRNENLESRFLSGLQQLAIFEGAPTPLCGGFDFVF